MNSLLILFVGCIYSFIGVKYFLQGNIGLGIVFIGYAASNVGLFMVGR